jgi:hypothetical protein
MGNNILSNILIRQVIEKDDLPDSSKPSSEVKLPDEIPSSEDPDTQSVEGPKTWEVSKTGFFSWISFNLSSKL